MSRQRYVCPSCGRDVWAVRPPRLCPYPRCGHTGPLERKAR